jgi:spermidine/putrescine transport system ATP-binding protein
MIERAGAGPDGRSTNVADGGLLGGSEVAPEIRLTDLSKHFREVRAVDHISLDIRTGEFFSMLGPSGCGKTTTLRMIGGFELPTSGRISLRGRDVTMDPPDKRPVNMVFQNYALFPHLDVAGNVAFGLRRKGVDKATTTSRVGEALDLVRLAGYQKRKPNQLSGGQQQRVAIARALVGTPSVLLADEPTGNLDTATSHEVMEIFKSLRRDRGLTIVVITHERDIAAYGSRTIDFRDGKVTSDVLHDETLAQPSHR